MARQLNKRTPAEQALYDKVMGPMNRKSLAFQRNNFHLSAPPLSRAKEVIKRHRICHQFS